MPGITSYGAYIPWYRMNRKIFENTFSFLGTTSLRGERSVASFDEDCITMASDAGLSCISGFDRNTVDALYFATTSQPYVIRQNAAIVAGSLDLHDGVRTADFTSCTKAGTTALLAAFDAVKAGSAKNVMVCAGEARAVKPNSPTEQLYGDGAAALMVGDDDVIATLEGTCSLTGDFPGRWKAADEKWEHYWEDRFIRDAGYGVLVPQAITKLMDQCKITIKDISKLAFCFPYEREHAALAKQLGAVPDQVQNNMLNTVGDTGAAYPLLMFVAALEEAKPGDRIMVVSFGSGCDAMLFRVTDKIAKMKDRWGVRKSLDRRRELTNWMAFACAHNSIPVDLGVRAEHKPNPSSMSYWWRERKVFLAAYGAKCKVCGTPQYPQRGVCANPDCQAIDQFDPYRFSDVKGKVFVYIIDFGAPTSMPPTISGAVDFEGGGRGYFNFTDWDPDHIKVGSPCELRFRRKYIDQRFGVTGYSWKVVPARE